jgi:hypothetical protein
VGGETTLCKGGSPGFYGATLPLHAPVHTSCLARAMRPFKVTLNVVQTNALHFVAPSLPALEASKPILTCSRDNPPSPYESHHLAYKA